MKLRIPYCVAIGIASVGILLAQTATGPGNPEDTGQFNPKGDTFYVNGSPDDVNNDKTESVGVGISSNGNVLIGWEDDGDGIKDIEAVWTLFNSSGVSLTPMTPLKAADGTTLTSKYLSYFRKDGSPTPGNTSWGPKIKANLFGDGLGMGATSYALGAEVPEFAAIQLNSDNTEGDFPSVQLLTNDGKPVAIVSGVSDADADPVGDIRVADWDYLANGNVVVVGESRQNDDLVARYKGTNPGKHAIYRILDQTGKEIKATALVSQVPDPNEIWHGVGVTHNGFAVRFSLGGRSTVRLFDNTGTAVSTNIDIAGLTGKQATASGDRGDGMGFHGNGVDAYVLANSGTDEAGVPQIWVTVLNANGSVRYTHAVADDLTLTKPGRVDAAIDPSGRVIVVFNDTSPTAGANSLVLGRMFDAQGKPVGRTFYVSEKETAATATQTAENPRIAWRNGLAAVVWHSKNDPDTANGVVGARLFSTFQPGSIESVGLKRIVPDTVVINPPADALGNWEPYASVLGTNTFLIEGNTFADGTTDSQRFVVALQPAGGGSMQLGEGFYADNGTPFKGAINASRQNGNPGRVAGDKRPGAVNFMVGGEASPHTLTEFQSDNRWNLGFDRLVDGRYATVESYSLDPATLKQTPLIKAQDAVNGRLTSGSPPGNQITRFGGDIVCLDNGNFVVVVDDRSQVRSPDNSTTAVIMAPNGTIVKESFLVVNQDIWANVAAFQGGFAIRVHSNIYFFDNSGALQGTVDQGTSGESFDAGRGDGTRITGHINSPFVFLAGKVTSGNIVKVAAFDSRTRAFAAIADVSEPGFAGDFDRVVVASDAFNRLVVSWVSKPPGYENQQVAARLLSFDAVKKIITPVTGSFLPFINAAATGGIRTLQMTAAMTTRQICIAAKGEINLQNKPELGANSTKEVNFFTVFSQPDPKDDPTLPVGGPAANHFTTKVTQASGQNWNGTIWQPGAVAPAAGNTYELVSNGTAFGNNLANTRVRNPASAGLQTFVGDSLTLDANTEIRAKTAGAILNFPGVGNNPGLILNGGVLNAGDDAVFTITGRVQVAATSYIVPADNGGGAVKPLRGFNISGKLSGSGTLVIYQAGTNVAQEISGSQNTFTGDLVVKAGWLKGSGNNSLGTGNITIDPKAAVNADASVTLALGPAWLELGYDISSPGKLTLQNGGTMILHQHCTFSSVTIEGTKLSAGTHPYSELAASFPANFAAGGSGSITVGSSTGPGPAFSSATLKAGTLTLSWTGGGKLQQADNVTGPWTDVTGSPNGTFSVQPSGARKFYRLIP